MRSFHVMFVRRKVSSRRPEQIFATTTVRPGDSIVAAVQVNQYIDSIYDRDLHVHIEFADSPLNEDGITIDWKKRIVAAGHTLEREYVNTMQVIEAAVTKDLISDREIQLDNFRVEDRYWVTEPVLSKLLLRRYDYRNEDVAASPWRPPVAGMPSFEIPWEGLWCRDSSCPDGWAYRV